MNPPVQVQNGLTSHKMRMCSRRSFRDFEESGRTRCSRHRDSPVRYIG